MKSSLRRPMRPKKSVGNIDISAFTNCLSLAIKVKAKTPCKLNETGGSGVHRDCTIYVPTGSKELYEAAKGWRQFENIEEDPSLDDD